MAAQPIDGVEGIRQLLLARLTPDEQAPAVRSAARRTLVIAGAGSGKTEVMARRVAWWVGVEAVPKDQIVAFTFTERAAEEMKFRIREWIGRITPTGTDATLSGMYVGTIHAYCMRLLRSLEPDRFHAFEVLDDVGRISLLQRRFHNVLGLAGLRAALTTANGRQAGMYATMELFLNGYDLLNEYGELDVQLPETPAPVELNEEEAWARQATLVTNVGEGPVAQAFAVSAARYYALLQCRRFLDFSTTQAELAHLLESPHHLAMAHEQVSHVVVDEVQDLNPIQDRIVRSLVGEAGHLTAVGDHRQAIFGWRGGRVEIMARWHSELAEDPDAEVLELNRNFRSTPRIIQISNTWSATIQAPGTLPNPQMLWGREQREDYEAAHIGSTSFPDRPAEAAWIAETVAHLVRPNGHGARHDGAEQDRGLTYSDIAVLLRSSTEARAYVDALRARDIPVVFRAGPDLFSQPEVLLFLAALSHMASIDQFVGLPTDARTLPARILRILNCRAVPTDVISAACDALRADGLALPTDAAARLILAGELVQERLRDEPAPTPTRTAPLRSARLKAWLRGRRPLRRVFPQSLLHFLLEEAGVETWDSAEPRAQSAMFHLGQLSRLVTGLETPGWTRPSDLRYQLIALVLWGTQGARAEEAPLLTAPDAVLISTIHGVKGLEYPAVFMADVCSWRFPSSLARRQQPVPFDGPILTTINPADLADDANLNAERRLMYVALTRAERYLFVSSSRPSQFHRQLDPFVAGAAGVVAPLGIDLEGHVEPLISELRRDSRLVTSFSDIRYFLECPHDFYLRKVMGLSPTIDQAFGYGRGVHNVLRAIHTDPQTWAALAAEPDRLRRRIEDLVNSGLFYLRHTTAAPAENMRRRAAEVITEYVLHYADELGRLQFEPEREFETLLEEEQTLITGAIDVVRLDDPPRISIIDFKSGEPQSDAHALDEEEMRLQVTVYGLAAKHELEYEPDRGLVRYLGGDEAGTELQVDLTGGAIAEARAAISETTRSIRQRTYFEGPAETEDPANLRCVRCDFLTFCGMPVARATRERLE